MQLTKAEKRLSWLLLILTILFGLALLANIVLPIVLKPARAFLQDHLPFVVNSAAKMGALLFLSFLAYLNVRENFEMTKILIWIHALSVVVLASFAILGQASEPVRMILIGGIGLDGGLFALLFVFYRSALKSNGRAQIFNEMQQDSFEYLVDAIIPPPEKRAATPEKLTDRFEKIVDVLDSDVKNLLRTALDIINPILRFKSLEENLRATLRQDIKEALDSNDEVISNAARLVHILVTYLYYSDPAVDEQVGYVRFKNRPRGTSVDVGKSEIDVLTSIPKKEYDVCIVGSGVAGSVLAHRLSHAGKSVLILEAGRYYPENTATDDEFLQLARLYKTDVFSSAMTGSLPVLQAQCVGGGAVVNNAICFRMPQFVKKEWDAFGAPFDKGKLEAAYDKIGQELNIQPADKIMAQNSKTFLNPSRKYFLRGIEKLGIPHGTGNPDQIEEGFYTASVNIANCLGCGYCNLGCGYERKSNNLQKYLPRAIESGNCDIVAEARVEEVLTEIRSLGNLKARGLKVNMRNGKTQTVKAKKYIISAGALASTGILQRSFLISLLGLPLGKRFSANVGSPMHARFNERVNAYDGLQISDYFIEKDENGEWGWLAESWFNPPATQSQAIPGYLDVHFERMLNYPYYASIAPLVGTEPVGEIVLNVLTQRPELRFRLSDSDLAKLKRGLRRISEIFLEAGAEEIMLMTQKEPLLKSRSDLDRIDTDIMTPEDLLVISSGHPQGGNPMSDVRENGRYRGVVGTDFNVHGVQDLYLCDASVFPTSVKVNPQWTIMALAELCAESILSEG